MRFQVFNRFVSKDPNSKINKALLYTISSLAVASSFIARLFIELFAVVIGATPTIMSLLTSMRNLIQQIFQSSFGRISDKIGRKTMIFVGLIVSGVVLFCFSYITNPWILLLGVIIFSFGFASYVPSFTALQGDLTRENNRASFISNFTLLGALASMVFLLLVGLMSKLGNTTFEQYTIILKITAALFIIGSILILFFKEPETKRLEKVTVFSIEPIRSNRKFRTFIIINSIMSFFMATGWPIFAYVRNEYATALQNAYIWAVFSAFQIITLLLINQIIDKLKRKTLLLFGRIAMFYIPLNLTFVILWWHHWWIIAIGSAVSGISNAIFIVGQNSYILDVAKEEEKGTYTGLYSMFIGITMFLGSLIMGLIAEKLFIVLGKWRAITILLIVVSSGRLLGSLPYLLVIEPVSTR